MFFEVGGIGPLPAASRSSGGGGQEAPSRHRSQGWDGKNPQREVWGCQRPLGGLSPSAARMTRRERFRDGFSSRMAGF